MYDDNGDVVSEVVLKDRIHMSTEGIFVAVVTVQRGTGRMLSSPDIISRGFVYLRDSEELINSIRQYLKQKVAASYKGGRKDIDKLKVEMRDDITQVLYDATHRTPIVIPVINEVGASTKPVKDDGRDQKTPMRPNSSIRRPVVSPALQQQNRNFRPANPTAISFKRKPTGPSAGGLWTR
jgi:ribonuclease J